MKPPTLASQISTSFRGKQKIVASLLKDKGGALLDIGARDRVLAKGLESGKWVYVSADMEGTHDYNLDLERKLEFADKQFDCVVALDVLEHVDQIHQAFAELLRISRRWVVIALPNMCSYDHRVSLLFRGRPGTDKYDLRVEAERDRHRWFLNLLDVDAFIAGAGRRGGFRVAETVYEAEGGTIGRMTGWAVMSVLPGTHGFFAKRGIYVLEREV